MVMVNLLTARYFREDEKSVYVWITECRMKAYESSEAVTRRLHEKETRYSVVMGLAMLDGLFFMLSLHNCFTRLISLRSTLSTPYANTFPILSKLLYLAVSKYIIAMTPVYLFEFNLGSKRPTCGSDSI